MGKKTSPHDPVTAHPLAALKVLKDKMEADEAAQRAAETAKKEAAAARGELESRARPKAYRPPSAEPAKAKSASPEVWRPDMDARMFEVAMAGVVPLSAGPSRVSSRDPALPNRRATLDERLRRVHAEGGADLQVTWNPDGSVSGVRAGHSFALAALDRFATPQESCDLHRLDAVSAANKVLEFVRSRRARGLRVVCIVHGQGKRSPDGESVLRDAVVEALKTPPASGDIDAFATAPPHHGGAGAILVSLRS